MAATANLYHQPLQHHRQNGILEHNLDSQNAFEHHPDFFFCKALFDYESRDDASLSFRRGDIIKVASRLESGWWDGYLHDIRGWFPSNYVEVLTEDEVAELDNTSNHFDMNGPEWGHDLHRELSGPPSDFWVPQVASDGRIFYVNTHTGERSNELPTEADSDVEPLVNDNSSAVTMAPSTTYSVSTTSTIVASESTVAGFGLPKRSGTPEPWVKRLADDGMSYYYLNTVDSTTRWTPPSPPADPHSQNSFSFPDRGQRTDLSVRLERLSVYSDDSDINPLGILGRAAAHAHSTSQTRIAATPGRSQYIAPDLHAANELQATLEERFPATPDSLDDLAEAARAAITDLLDAAVVRTNINLVKDAIKRTTDAVRNLIYASSTLIPPMTSLPHPYTSNRNFSDSTELKNFHRKVTAAMVKFVVTIRASLGSEVVSEDMPLRCENDAAELERAIATFVDEVLSRRTPEESSRPVRAILRSDKGRKGIGLDLLGAGFAGSWKGLGFVEPMTGHRLGPDIESSVKQHKMNVQNALVLLQSSISAGQAVPDVIRIGQQCLQYLVAFLGLIADINVARALDFDSTSIDASYTQSVKRAKELVRALESTIQAAFEDGAVLLNVIQSANVIAAKPTTDGRAWGFLASVIPALLKNLDDVCSHVGELIEIAQLQVDACAQAGVDGSVGMRDAARYTEVRQRSDRDTIVYLPSTETGEGYLDDPSNPSDEDTLQWGDVMGTFGAERNRDVNAYGANGRDHSYSSTADSYENDRDQNGGEDADIPKGTPPTPSQILSSKTQLTPQQVADDDLLDDDQLIERPSKAPERLNKLKAIFGEDVPADIIEKVNPDDSKPWFLRAEHSSKDIWINPDSGVRGGTLPALIERLTSHDSRDIGFNSTFLLTFKSFSTVDEVFDSLVKRFYLQSPEGLTPEEVKVWTEQKQQFVRFRVINVLKQIVTDDNVLEKEDMYILERIKEFAAVVDRDVVPSIPAAKQLLVHVERAQSGGDAMVKRTHLAASTPPAPIMPKVNKVMKLLDIEPLELARQLTVMESKLFTKIRPMECLNRGRDVRTSDSDDNISAIIDTSNKVAEWVADTVLSKDDSRKRAAIVKQFIAVADRCRLLQNFSTMAALVAGLNSPPIRRLKRTWEQVGARNKTSLQEAERTMDTNKNFTNYRAILKSAQLPCVPFFGVYLSVLTFIQDGNKNMIQADIINFSKREKFAEVVREIKHYQSKPYNFTVIPAIQTFIDESLAALGNTPDLSDRAWNLSLEREPREREDEKMARLLQESGFL
ncbi:ras guanine nucleotide exchange factor domain-containing protein [Hysterangium stoloniferum]|nr:ras guanine nucleotide exchange factor domain-containing protein [Hysterangium stoloniferum]